MARLPENPIGADLEDFVAAHFAARRIFVEQGVTERDPKDLLELDVVWTDYRNGNSVRNPVEVKSGDWGLGDLFKFFGWSNYLKIEPGSFVCRKLPGRLDEGSISRLCERMGIVLCHIDDLDQVSHHFERLGLGDPSSGTATALWRYSFWAQRRLLHATSLGISEDSCSESGRVAKDYFKIINDAIFFEPDVRSRVRDLMSAHWEHPRLAKTAAAEMSGYGVDFEDPPDSDAFKNALFYGRHFPVQACLYLAHRARLAITKSCVDYILARNNNALPRQTIRIFGQEVDLLEAELHEAFQAAVDVLENSPNFHLYPAFWQGFLWRWGGFVLEDRIDREFEAFSAESGLPPDEIEAALSVWDRLFPGDGRWLVTPSSDCRRVLKLMPAGIRGIGAHARLILYNVNDYEELGLPGKTAERLASDHNCAVRLLDGADEELCK